MKRIIMMTAALLVLITGAGVYAADNIEVKGSDTMINVVQALAEAFMDENPDAMIAVTGGGSGTGIAALINKKCNLANASRDIKDKEVEDAKANGVDPKLIVVGIDGISIIVHKDNSVAKLTMDQVGKIYKGEIKNWKEVGGADKEITLYGRQNNSGTYAFLQEHVLKGDYSSKMNQMNGNAQIGEAVARDEAGIGYVGVGYAKDAKGVAVLKIAIKEGAEYLSPLDSDAVKSGEYAISRTLNQYVNGTPKGDIKAFLEFELSKEGEKIVEEMGFITISDDLRKKNEKTLSGK